MSKVIFAIQPQSMVDVITNSSSELFVFKGKEKEVLEGCLRGYFGLSDGSNIYEECLMEYEPLKSMSELSADDLEVYIEYCYVYGWDRNPDACGAKIIPGFSLDEMYNLTDQWGMGYQYSLVGGFVEDNFEKIKKNLDPNNNMYFLFSVEDNPEYETQEKLEMIATRYHLG